MASLAEIADGAAFDVAEAIRVIAKHLTLREMLQGKIAVHEGDGLDDLLDDLLDARVVEILRRAGLDTTEQVRRVPDAGLLSLDGIGDKTVVRIRTRLATVQPGDGESVPEQQLRFEQLDTNLPGSGLTAGQIGSFQEVQGEEGA